MWRCWSATAGRLVWNHCLRYEDDGIDDLSDHSATGGGAVLKILVGVGLGFLLFTNPEARQITADLLRSIANAIAPEQDGKTFHDRVKDAVVEKVVEGD